MTSDFSVAASNEAHEWQPIESAPKDGTSILTVGLDAPCRVFETRWLSPGPYVRTPNGSFYKPDGWYWSGWDGAVGPIAPTLWTKMPEPPVTPEKQTKS